MFPQTQVEKTRRAAGETRHLALLTSLLLLFVIAPFVAPLRSGPVVISIGGAIVVVSGAYAVSERRYLLVVTLI
ncbi:MAG: hypothetical protein ACREP1_06380, partial [Rhodanobacteraceae bacterium]